ncbi:MAG: hypothetical protein QM535_20710 [Limnohabitans sp.]|nr:hypothetical protein [Limnohabitans sp.]
MLKPKSYDSLNNFQTQSRLIDYKQYIRLKIYLPPCTNPKIGTYTDAEFFLFTKIPTKIQVSDTMKLMKNEYENILSCVYKPFHYYSGNVNGNTYAGITSDAKVVSEKYFTIIDILYDKELNDVWNQTDSILWSNRDNKQLYVDRNGFKGGTQRPTIILKLINDINGDTLYCVNPRKFIFVPFFLKQKQLYDKKIFIARTREGEGSEEVMNIKTNEK